MLCFLVMASSLIVFVVSGSASVALPFQAGMQHGIRKSACDPYEDKTVRFDWKVIPCLAGSTLVQDLSFNIPG
jgi:hypothetical protein